MGLVKRPLYKPDRRKARPMGSVAQMAPIGCPDATQREIVGAVWHLARQKNVIVGRALGYDQLKDRYTVLAKKLSGGTSQGRPVGKVLDFEIEGADVAIVIKLARTMNGGRRLGRVY